jgi:hypothetical protein
MFQRTESKGKSVSGNRTCLEDVYERNRIRDCTKNRVWGGGFFKKQRKKRVTYKEEEIFQITYKEEEMSKVRYKEEEMSQV